LLTAVSPVDILVLLSRTLYDVAGWRLVITFFLDVAIIGAGHALPIAARAARVSSRIFAERLIGKGSK
jgi:hypothetical protein